MPRPAPAVPRLPDDFTPAARRALAKTDPVLGALMKRVGPFRLELRPLHSPFESLARSIVYQQLHGRAAATIFARVCERVGQGRGFTPQALMAVPDAALREAGLSANKLAAMRDLAAKSLDGTVPPLARVRRMDDATLIDHFTQVRGIGQWTVEMLLIFSLGRPDVLPVDDFGVRKGFMLTYGLKEMPRPKELLAYGERWRPWRSVASWYFWRATELPPADGDT
ncbi:DNA-3-methyladenine glycosylase 2 family protein [Pyxidicoccus fallax]|uniref:DNA-3-methyladenine glycosylase II n=1 Tax=Pyxidicoccus fallax TaxID=394095 RepID=A0A848LN70_9BACT|nr:DNA-3-methyladenine glycosylase [Pyxidicoccus fallax]NMO19295.1 DNA-3-methyladenine glycosylase 2 family protein [Pyxidicoccus fallax]NPC81728.1 DNA-3-methyladenine glycosylase 2 family protein [Pyxidicoccus fallax]